MTGASIVTGGLAPGVIGSQSAPQAPSVPHIDLAPTGREVNLIEPYLTTIGQRPIVAGDTWSQLLRVVDIDGNPVDLTGASIAMTAQSKGTSETFFVRSTDADLAGVTGAKQIELGDDPRDGTFTIRFSPGDENALLELAESPGADLYDLRIRYADGSIETRALGRIDVLKPLGRNSALP